MTPLIFISFVPATDRIMPAALIRVAFSLFCRHTKYKAPSVICASHRPVTLPKGINCIRQIRE